MEADPSGRFGLFWQSGEQSLGIATDTSELGTEPDPIFLAAAILRCPELARGRSAIEGVNRLEAGCTARFKATQLHHLTEVNPVIAPDDSLTFEEAAYNLRYTLTAAMEKRIALGKIITSDCSGGLDSTTLALLVAERSETGIDTFFQYLPGVRNGDLRYARAIDEVYPLLRLHEVLENQQSLPFYELMEGPLWGQPDPTNILKGRIRQRLGAASDYGSALHLLGECGDAILDAPIEILADLAQEGRSQQLEQARFAYGSAYAVDPGYLYACAQATVGRTLHDDFVDIARFLKSSALTEAEQPFRWIAMPYEGSVFLTAAMRQRLSEASEQQAAERKIPEEIKIGDYVAHAELQRGGFVQQYLQPLAREYGVDLHFPYMDRSVVAACLQLPAYLRGQPGEFKPLLKAAFSDVIPEMLATRTTKGTYGPAMYRGLRAARPIIKSLFDKDCQLAELGIIEPSAVQVEIDKLDMGLSGAFPNLEAIVSAEVWLRQRAGC